MKKLAAAFDSRLPSLQNLERRRLLFRVATIPFESPRGYLCRVAHAHAYCGPWWLAELAGITPGGLEQQDRGAQLAHVLRLEASEWLGICYRRVKGKRHLECRSFLGQMIGAHHLNYRYPRVCPGCLRNSSVWWAIWDLKLVSACPIHRCRLIDRCPACQRRLTWHRRSVHECRCGLDLRKVKAEPAESSLVTINAAIHCAAGYYREHCESELQRAKFVPVLADLRLDALLNVVRFLGSIQEEGRLRRKQIRPFAELGAATRIGVEAATMLLDWPVSFREMLRRMVPGEVKNAASLNFDEVFGNFYRHLFHVLPRKEFGFLHHAFEKFVVEDWPGLVRGGHSRFPSAIRGSTQWISAAKAQKTAGIPSRRIGALVRKGELEGILVNAGRHRTECWVRRESLSRWTAKRESELACYMSRPEAKRALGLKHDTVMKIAQAGLIRYINGSEKLLRTDCNYFLREDVLQIKCAFERHPVCVQPYSSPGKVIALRHGLKNYLGRNSGLPAVVRAVVDGRLAPVGYTKRFPGITGYLFLSEELRRYRPVNTGSQPEDFLNYSEAAFVLGTRNEIVRGLVAHGILSTSNEYQSGLSKLIPARDVQRFAAEYVDATILTRRSGETIHWVKSCLRESAAPILEISVPNKGQKIFLPRTIATKIQILPRRYCLARPSADYVINRVKNVG
jgi:hypothetical protein